MMFLSIKIILCWPRFIYSPFVLTGWTWVWIPPALRGDRLNDVLDMFQEDHYQVTFWRLNPQYCNHASTNRRQIRTPAFETASSFYFSNKLLFYSHIWQGFKAERAPSFAPRDHSEVSNLLGVKSRGFVCSVFCDWLFEYSWTFQARLFVWLSDKSRSKGIK